jgi:glycosyltransferase involved in cell wall biosynthesis
VDATVSVVIPTTGRASLRQAITSALEQTRPVLEVIVVADTAGELDLVDDPRVHVERVGPGAGGNVARQHGISCAQGSLIALLDDDDEWMPEKLEAQLKAVEALPPGDPWLVSCRLLAWREGGEDADEHVLPAKPHDESLDLTRYLLRRSGIRRGQGMAQASTLLFPKYIADEVPFDPKLKFHQDLSWLLSVAAHYPNLRFVQLAAPLVRFRLSATSLSAGITPAKSRQWIVENTRSADAVSRGDFLLTQPVVLARRRGEPTEILKSMRQAFTVGRPSAAAFAYASASYVASIPTWYSRRQERRGR